MAVYGNMVITQAGQTLYGKVQTGTTLTFTRMQIGSGKFASALTAALTSGTQYTALSVQALPSQITSGDSILIGSGPTTQTVTASATASAGATSISVNAFNANANYAANAPVMDSTTASALTALITPIDYVTINAISSSGGTANVRGIYQNTNLTQSTYTCEIGLFAQDPTAGEILYAYANAGTQGDTIPPYADGPYSRQFQINTAVGNATSVTANIPANTYIPTSEIGAANGVAPLDASSKVPTANLPTMNYIPTSAEGAANGVATLDASGKVPVTQLGNGVTSVNGQTGAVTVQGYNPLNSPNAWF